MKTVTFILIVLATASQAVPFTYNWTSIVRADAAGIQYNGAWETVQLAEPAGCGYGNNVSSVRTVTSGPATITYTFQGSAVAPLFVSTDKTPCSVILHVDEDEAEGEVQNPSTTGKSPTCTWVLSSDGLDPGALHTATVRLDSGNCTWNFAGFRTTGEKTQDDGTAAAAPAATSSIAAALGSFCLALAAAFV